ncbi:MAG: muconate cycloisomerase [Alphaproteobacteria bacterium]|jgi:muconate cycloisomerase|nr:muconate cycloisomerase [Alphaproteobacteria bacterium]
MLEKTARLSATATSQPQAAGGDHAPLTIRRIDAIPVALPLKTPMKMSAETIAAAQNLLVRIEAADGTVGWGEAASAPTMTGDTQGGMVAAVRDHLAPMIAGKDARDWQALRRVLHRALLGNGGAHSAVEMAVLDLIGRATGIRLIDLVGRPRRNGVKPMWLLGNKTADEDVAEARARQTAGFDFFKLKIGVKPLAKEIAIAFAVREALPKTPLCADANCGLTLAAARSYVEKTKKARLMFVEQPLAYDDVGGLKKLARGTKVPIGVDEGIHSFADIATSAKAGAGGVSLKLIKLGGITAAIEAGKLCQRLGLSVNIAAKIAESSISSAAALHLACAVPKADWGVSLTHFYLAEDLVRRPLAVSGGLVALPDGPGLGIEVDESAVQRFRVR